MIQTLRVRPDPSAEPGASVPRSARATGISLVIHALLVVALWQVLQFPGGLHDLVLSRSEVREEVFRQLFDWIGFSARA